MVLHAMTKIASRSEPIARLNTVSIYSKVGMQKTQPRIKVSMVMSFIDVLSCATD